MNRTDLPVVLTMGDACGIGPEILAKLFRGDDARGAFVLGDAAVMRRAAALTGGMLALACIDHPADAATVPPNCIPLLQASGLPPGLADAPLGQVDARAGSAAAACIEQAAASASLWIGAVTTAATWPAIARRAACSMQAAAAEPAQAST
jgi:4-hydroxythreonine-4-phosphate dehydrogenase